MYRDEYEISIWQGSAKDEFKICNIGSDKLTCSARALEPKLTQKITGENTFSFKMYKDCYDTVIKDEIYLLDINLNYLDENDNLSLLAKSLLTFTGKYSNPFLPYLINERRIKVKWNNKWYEFVIKNIKEDSAQKSYTFECTDWIVQSLSKQGFNLEFDEKLENNQGTIWELSDKILKNTEWTVIESEIGKEYNKEAVYDISVLNNFNAFKLPNWELDEIPADDHILVFFSSVIGLDNSGTTTVQFCYNQGKSFETDYNSQLIINSETMNYQITANYIFDNTTKTYEFSTDNTPIFTISLATGVSAYRAKRLVNSLKVEYDSITDKYANVLTRRSQNELLFYTLDDEPLYISVNNVLYPIYRVDDEEQSETDIYYEFKDINTNFAKYVQNLATNSVGFTNSNGWRYSHNYDQSTNKCITDELAFTIDTSLSKSYLIIPQTQGDGWIFNSSIRSSRSFVNNFINGQTYYIRIKLKDNTDYNKISDIIIADYVNSDCYYPDPNGETYFQFNNLSLDPKSTATDTWYIANATCSKGKSFDSLMDAQIGLFFHTDQAVLIEEIQLFKEVLGTNNSIIYPAEFDSSGVIEDKYLIYNHTAAIDNKLNKDQLEFIYENQIPYSESGELDFVYMTNNFNKIRTLKGKESNRFNLLQNLAETFEVWLKITIGHDETGKIATDPEDPTKLQMYITFVDQVGEDQNIGFIYGLDLKQVQRTIDSKEIVTKTIVKDNSNKYANNGFCSIARAVENYPKTNYILNFDYYINQGLIDSIKLNDDLYNKDTGYLTKLHDYNTQYDTITEKLNEYQLQYDNLFAYLKVFKQYKEEAQGKSYDYKIKILNMAGVQFDDTNRDTIDTKWAELYDDGQGVWYVEFCKDGRNSSEYRNGADVNAWVFDDARITAEQNEHKYDETIESLEESIESLSASIDRYNTEAKNLTTLISAADLEFLQSYGSFIQEGTWSSEDYMNDTSYYLDALDVAYTSAWPRITYSINVLRLSALPEFKNKRFKLGDIAYVEDTEFFGYVYINGIKTPYHEKVVLTELTEYLDEPSKDQFKVQNYRTQFEDLFQRITASVQSLQWNQADYGRAVEAVSKDLTINTDILQASYTKAQDLVRSSLNNQVIQDATGITIINSSNPLEQSHIVAQGFFISDDGGETWRNAVSGSGIATELLTAGAIDTNRISLVDGSHELFRWDKTGLNAYKTKQSTLQGQTYGTFVRFDKWGIYGRDGSDIRYNPSSELAIWNDPNTKFALTWNGMLVKGSKNNTSILIGTNPDQDNFGITIKKNNSSVFYADDSGNLHLTGTLEAEGGHIGGENGFIIESNKLYTSYTYSGINTYAGIYNAGTNTDANTKVFYAGANNTTGTDAKFSVTTDGTINAIKGQIGGVQLYEHGLYVESQEEQEVQAGIHDGSTNEIFFYAGDYEQDITTARFRVTSDGMVIATRGKVGGFQINDYSIYNAKPIGDGSYYIVGMSNQGTGNNNIRFAAGIIDNDGTGSWSNAAFKVTNDGSLYSTKGKIGGFTIDDTSIYSDNPKPSELSGVGMSHDNSRYAFWSIGNGGRFMVGSDGVLTCTGANIGGTLNGATGTFAGSLTATELTLSNAGLKITRELWGTIIGRTYYSASLQPQVDNGYSSNLSILINALGLMPQSDNVQQLGASSHKWSTIYAQSSTINTSSRKQKTDIQDISNNYEIFFNNLNPQSYLMQGSTSIRRNIGFILDEVGSALNKANLTGTDFAGYCLFDQSDPNGEGGLRYEEFVALNTWQIQKLKKRVTQLENQLQQLQL